MRVLEDNTSYHYCGYTILCINDCGTIDKRYFIIKNITVTVPFHNNHRGNSNSLFEHTLHRILNIYIYPIHVRNYVFQKRIIYFVHAAIV